MPIFRPSPPLRARVAATGVGALVLGLCFAGSAVASERATFRLLGSSPVYANSIDVHTAAGGTSRVRPARYHYRIITPGSGGAAAVTTEASGNCVDLAHYIVTGRDYQVDLQTADDAPELATPAFQSAGWLLSRSDALIGAAPDPAFEAGALQVAIWQLSGQARDLDAPTSDTALNARVAELQALAAGRQVPSQLAVSVAGGDTCLDTAAPVTVTGTPGAEVDLSVDAPAGTDPTALITPARVTLSAGGVGYATLRSSTVGPATVTARMSAPIMVRATKTPGATSPQDQLFLRPRVLSAQTSHSFIDCDLHLLGPSDPLAPPAPAVPAPPAGSGVVLSLDSPRLAAPGGEAVYRLRVTNTGSGTARRVRVGQRLARGVQPLSARGPRGSSARLARGAARWTLAPLGAGHSATLVLRVRVARNLAGGVARTSVALRAGGRSENASATTSVVRRVGKTEQGF